METEGEDENEPDSHLAIIIFLAHKEYFSQVFGYINKVLRSTESYNNNKMPWDDNIRVFYCSPDITPGDKINLRFPVFGMIRIASVFPQTDFFYHI